MNDYAQLVSVIVPVYGVEKYIEKCAKSLFEQTIDNIEFIFVNDCTNDRSIVVLEKVIAMYPDRLCKIVHHKKNMGLACARKTGFKYAQGNYWACCDSDDWVEPNMYEKLLATAEQNDADIVCCGIIKEEETRSVQTPYPFFEDSLDKVLNPHFWGNVTGAIWNKLVKAELYKSYNIQPWEGVNMWEDSCLTTRLRFFSKKTIIIEDCLYHYNITNVHSITYSFKLDKVLQMEKATRKMTEFFTQQNLFNESENLVNFLKVSSKEVLLRFPTKENFLLFRSIFPETTDYLLYYPNWSFLLKLRAWLVMVLPEKLAFFVLKHMRR